MLFNRQLMPMLMRLAILLPMLPCACLAGNETSSLKHKDGMTGTPPATSHVNNRFADRQTDISLAFLPDVHFQDLHASFGPDGFPGLRDAKGNQPWTIRTMQAQVRSTRLFNESYFALRTALDDIVARNIYFVILNGDLSDDGQPVHMEGLKHILNDYERRHGITFFVTPGNHDINRPFTQPAGKRDYLARDPTSGRIGYAQTIASPGYRFAPMAGIDAPTATSPTPLISPFTARPSIPARPASYREGVYWTPAVREMGYAEFTQVMAPFGVMPRPEYLYYETPYSDYTPASYTFEKAWAQASLSHRTYPICREGSASRLSDMGAPPSSASPSFCKAVPDLSYLVEPRKDLWLLMIDANVFVPSGEAENDFTPAGNAGFNRMVTHKAHVIEWMQQVAQRATASGKRLVTSSHYPALDWMQTRGDTMARLFGTDSAELCRRPTSHTAKQVAATGVRLHIGGHMHNNAATVRVADDGTPPLVNIQVGALGAYAPAYKIVTLHGANEAIIDTIPIVDTHAFKTLFPLYREEHRFLCDLRRSSAPRTPIWPLRLLAASDYKDFTRRHLAALTAVRLIKQWPPLMKIFYSSHLSGRDLMTLAAMHGGPTVAALGDLTRRPNGDRDHAAADFNDIANDCAADDGLAAPSGESRAPPPSVVPLPLQSLLHAQNHATSVARTWAQANGMQLEDFEQWSARDIVDDFTRLHWAGSLAMDDIAPERLAQYDVLTRLLDAAPGIACATTTPLTSASASASVAHTCLAAQSSFPALIDTEAETSIQNANDAVTAQQPFAKVFQAYFHPLMHLLRDLATPASGKRIAIDLNTGNVREF